MKTGYPFLAISKKHNIPYEDILMAADHYKHRGTEESRQHSRAFMFIPNAAMVDIHAASQHFEDVRQGKKDWQDHIDIS